MTRALAITLLLLSAASSVSPALAQEVAPPPPATNAVGLGDLLVAPTRVILEGRDRSAELTLVNTGPATATYRISFVNLRMSEAGQMQEIEEPGPGDRFADPLIRYSPRQVVLEPGVAQTVRIQVRKPADLEAGEYRSHLLFRAIPDLESIGAGVESEANPTELNIRLIPIYGISIPIIVRHGEVEAQVALTGATFNPATDQSPASLTVRVERQGNRSVYGHLRATLRSGGEEVAGARGMAVYVPNEFRTVTIPLQFPDGRAMSGEVISLAFFGAETTEERALAKAELQIP